LYGWRTADALATEAVSAFIDGDELRGHWLRPVIKLRQSLVPPLAAPLGAGHRLTMRFRR
jgi:hypothetical protein